MASTRTPESALAAWRSNDPIRPDPHGGLINETWTVGDPPWAVLQWVNPIFDPSIHLDIDAATAHLEAAGLTTPRLLPTAAGGLWADDETGCWRLMTYIPGTTVDRIESPEQAAEAGALVGRFHAALDGWDYRLQAPRRYVHDTTFHMAELHAARTEAPAHPLAREVYELGTEILGRWAEWGGEPQRHERFSHGDLKISNVRFDPSGRQAVCLIDLDTLGQMPISCEMGDAWRSWCNPLGEDCEACRFDVEVFTASAHAWMAAAPTLDERERRGLVPGIERICLELAARFCADAVRNTYFREDRERWPEPGAHNLLRARGQLSLALSARAERSECEAVVATA